MIGVFLQLGTEVSLAEELFSLSNLRVRQHFSPPPPSFLLFLLPRFPFLLLQPRLSVTLDPWPALTASYLDPLLTVTSAECCECSLCLLTSVPSFLTREPPLLVLLFSGLLSLFDPVW